MLLEVAGDLPCHSDALRLRGSSYYPELVLLSIFGPRNAVRAAWATLVSNPRRGHPGTITVGGKNVRRTAGTAYITQTAPLERGILHCVMFHQQLGHNAPDLGYFYQTGPDAGRRYFTRLSRRCPVPMREAWVASLWDIGRAHGAIVEVAGHGREAWWVSTKREVWEPIVRDALIAKELR